MPIGGTKSFYPVKALGPERILTNIKFTGNGAASPLAATIFPKAGSTVTWVSTGLYDVVLPGKGSINADRIWAVSNVESSAIKNSSIVSFTAATRTLRVRVVDNTAVAVLVDLTSSEKMHLHITVKNSSTPGNY